MTKCLLLTTIGKAPFVVWFKKIKDFTIKSRIERRIERLESGNYGDYKPIGEGIYELRLVFGPGYRVYFGEINKTIIILDKSSQTKDIEMAKKYWNEIRGDQYG